MKTVVHRFTFFFLTFLVPVFGSSQCICPSVQHNYDCTQQYDPVCGCDNETYGNACTAGVAGVKKYKMGACGSTTGDWIYSVCPNGNAVDENCGCETSTSNCICPEIQHDNPCVWLWDPICGCDNVTYSNTCLAEIAGVKKYKMGECGSTTGGWIYSVCPNGNTVDENCGCETSTSNCICPELQHDNPCINVYDPVCGCDNVTYSNTCFAGAAGVKKYKMGECGSTTGGWIYSVCPNGNTIDENCSCGNDNTSSCRYQDSLALVQLYNETGGANWTYNPGEELNIPNRGNKWLSGIPINQWHGITLNNEGCVELINLYDNGLTGTISTLKFSQLRRFMSAKNRISGSIPALDNVPKLEHFNCALNKFSGSIPSLDNVPKLESFYCTTNSIGDTIPDLSKLSKLTHFACSRNKLTGKIPNLDKNLNLEYFACSYNELSGTIPSVDTLVLLEHFFCAANKLTGSIPDLTNNKFFRNGLFYNNMLTGSIPALAHLDSLRSFYAHKNKLSGCYSDKKLCSLTYQSKPSSTYVHNGRIIEVYPRDRYKVDENSHLPWQGDMAQYCATDGSQSAQVGAPCDDGDASNGTNDVIQEDCSCAPPAPPCGSHPDYAPLMALYNSTNGANWTNNTGWVDGAAETNCDPCNGWYGVTCTEGRVTELSLSVQELTGSIPSEIGDATELKKLKLSFNNLGGSIPVSVGNLSKLEELFLEQNNLSGSIPAELGNLSNLRTLFLHFNQLSGVIPAELGNMTNLSLLRLAKNYLTGNIPTELANLSNLTHLMLQDNNLEGCYPDGFSNFVCSLQTKNLSNNPLLPWQGDVNQFCATDGSQSAQVGAPCDDGDASNGTSDVIQDDCSCSKTPTLTCRMQDSINLVNLYNETGGSSWTYNPSSGTSEVANRGNRWLEGPIDQWHGIKLNSEGCVTEINLFDNGLNGVLTSLVFPQLRNFYCDKNQLEGTLPPLDGIPQIININFARNKFEGMIPSLDHMPKLELFFCTTNRLTGSIPKVESLEKLKFFSCSRNQLTGGIPELSSNQNLKYFACSHNELSGEIPSLENLLLLEIFFCAANQLTGTLPDISKNTFLKHFYFYKNNITGALPDLSGLDLLTSFYGHDNNLSGCLQDTRLCSLPYQSGPNNTYNHNGRIIEQYPSRGYKIDGNPLLPWQGDYQQFCATDGSQEAQVGAPCDDGEASNGTSDVIQEDCSCEGSVSTSDPSADWVYVYPHPVTDILYIYGAQGQKYRLHDIYGRTMTSGIYTEGIDVSTYSSGVYILQIYDTDRWISRKVKVVSR